MPDPSDAWVSKAEGDVDTALRELGVPERPNWDAVCFHAQQAVEKYFKAVLIKQGDPFLKTHDLAILMGLVAKRFPQLEADIEDLNWLTFAAVEARYPGEEATKEEAVRAVEVMQRWRLRLRNALGLSG